MPPPRRLPVRPGPPWALIGAAMLLILPAAAASAADDRTTEAVAGKADEKAGATEAIRALLDRGEAAEALVRADRAIAADPRDVPVVFLRGVALMDLGRDAEALAHFERMTQDYPELPDPWNNIALLHVRAGQLELALQALERALRNDPSHRTARANLGLVHLMLAARAWETVAATGPVDALLKRRLEGVRALLTDDAR